MLLQLFLCNAPCVFQLLKKCYDVFFSRAQGSCYIHKTSIEQSSELGKVLLSILFYEFNDLITAKDVCILVDIVPKSAFQW